jgi:ribosomal protein L18E
MARWAQGVQAMETHASTGEEGEPRGFWTMAAELIRLKMRQKAEAEAAREAKRQEGRRGGTHQGDGGVVVIGAETTGTGDGARVTVICALRMHTARTEREVREGAETGTFWHDAVRRAPNGQDVRRIEEALEWMDSARAIRIYTRRREDTHALEAAYAGDRERLRAHQAKTVDVGMEAFKAGRASTQAEVLRASGHEAHERAEGAAERQWLDGRLAEMEWWCKARTRALGRVLLEGNAQIPGGHSIHGTTVRREVVRGDSRRRQGEAHTPHDQTQEAARRTASHGKRGRDADAHDDGRAETHGGGRRHRTDGGSGQHTASDPPAGRHGMAQGADAASTHLGEGSRGERRAAAREEEDGGDDDEPGGTTGRAGDAAAEEREEAEDGIQTRRCAPTATAEQGPTTSQTDFHGGNRLRVGRVAAASTLPTLGNGSSSKSSSLGEEFPLPLHRSREIDARNIQTGKRERTQPPEHDYGEVQRRKARGGWTPTYFTQARKRQKRDDIQMGAATLARVTGGGYDHRDGGHARRKRLFAGGGRRANKAGRHQ